MRSADCSAAGGSKNVAIQVPGDPCCERGIIVRWKAARVRLDDTEVKPVERAVKDADDRDRCLGRGVGRGPPAWRTKASGIGLAEDWNQVKELKS